jgi:hypothetical protein
MGESTYIPRPILGNNVNIPEGENLQGWLEDYVDFPGNRLLPDGGTCFSIISGECFEI